MTDKRILRTRRLLHDALIAEALDKPIEAITIQDITDRADIGYRTFFRHYADRDALLDDVLESTVDEIDALLFPPDVSSVADVMSHYGPEQNGQKVFEHVAAHPDLYRVFFRSGKAIRQQVVDRISERVLTLLSLFDEPPVPREIIANHTIQSMLALIEQWLDDDMPYTPEQMGSYWARLIINPITQFLMPETSNATQN